MRWHWLRMNLTVGSGHSEDRWHLGRCSGGDYRCDVLEEDHPVADSGASAASALIKPCLSCHISSHSASGFGHWPSISTTDTEYFRQIGTQFYSEKRNLDQQATHVSSEHFGLYAADFLFLPAPAGAAASSPHPTWGTVEVAAEAAATRNGSDSSTVTWAMCRPASCLEADSSSSPPGTYSNFDQRPTPTAIYNALSYETQKPTAMISKPKKDSPATGARLLQDAES